MFMVIAWLFCAVAAAIIARGKNRSAFTWFCLGILVGPLAFAVALFPEKTGAAPAQPTRPTAKRLCPTCGYPYEGSPGEQAWYCPQCRSVNTSL